MIKQILYCGLTIIAIILVSILFVKAIDLFMIKVIQVSINDELIQSIYSVFIMSGLALSIFILGQNRFFEK